MLRQSDSATAAVRERRGAEVGRGIRGLEKPTPDPPEEGKAHDRKRTALWARSPYRGRNGANRAATWNPEGNSG